MSGGIGKHFDYFSFFVIAVAILIVLPITVVAAIGSWVMLFDFMSYLFS